MQNNNKLLCWQYTISMDITSSQRWSTLNGASFDWMLLHRSNCTPHRNINSISSSQPSIFSFAIINRSSSQSPAQQSNIIHIHTELMAFALCDIAIQQASISSQPMELFRHLGRRMKSNSISCLYMVWYIAIKLALGQTVQSYKWKRLQIDTKTHTQIHTQYKRALDVTPPQYHWLGSTSSTRHFCKSCTFHSFFCCCVPQQTMSRSQKTKTMRTIFMSIVRIEFEVESNWNREHHLHCSAGPFFVRMLSLLARRSLCSVMLIHGQMQSGLPILINKIYDKMPWVLFVICVFYEEFNLFDILFCVWMFRVCWWLSSLGFMKTYGLILFIWKSICFWLYFSFFISFNLYIYIYIEHIYSCRSFVSYFFAFLLLSAFVERIVIYLSATIEFRKIHGDRRRSYSGARRHSSERDMFFELGFVCLGTNINAEKMRKFAFVWIQYNGWVMAANVCFQMIYTTTKEEKKNIWICTKWDNSQ